MYPQFMRQSIATVLLLVFIAFVSSEAHALVLCQEADGYNHITSNAQKAQTKNICPPGKSDCLSAAHLTATFDVVSPVKGCQDIWFSTSLAQAPHILKIKNPSTVWVFDPFSIAAALNFSTPKGLSYSLPSSLLPPSQSMRALRSIVLII